MKQAMKLGQRFAISIGVALTLALAQTTKGVQATAPGASVVTSNGYYICTFTNNGTFSVTSTGIVDVLVVAGGGGGGKTGGGGGASGMMYSNSYPVVASNYTVTVGGGGAGSTSRNSQGGNGTNSIFGPLLAIGGGGGGSFSLTSGNTGGSGGGSTEGGTAGSSMSGQGHMGGGSASGNVAGGGGGGAGAAGASGVATGNIGGNGGAGSNCSISGAVVTYAGGGGGGGDTAGTGGSGGGGAGSISTANATTGSPNTGGGGGGSRDYMDTAGNGGNGGSGIVIVRYLVDASLPIIADLPPTNVLAGAAWMNGYLQSNGTSTATVVLYWGSTDGGINAAKWANTNTFVSGQWVNASYPTTNITTLASQDYYYTYAASNASGMVWAQPSVYFTEGALSLTATDNSCGTTPSDTATVTVTRPSNCTNASLTVYYTVTNVTSGAYYNDTVTPANGSLTIPTGQTSASITITPVSPYNLGLPGNIVITLAGGGYLIGSANTATCTLQTLVFTEVANTYFTTTSGAWDYPYNWNAGLPGIGATNAYIGSTAAGANPATASFNSGDSATAGSLTLGNEAAGRGTLNMSGGTLILNSLTCGNNGTGTIMQTGGVISNASFGIAGGTGSTGLWTIAGGVVTNGGSGWVAYNGNAMLVISNTGSMVGGNISIGNSSGGYGSGKGTVLVANGGSFGPLASTLNICPSYANTGCMGTLIISNATANLPFGISGPGFASTTANVQLASAMLIVSNISLGGASRADMEVGGNSVVTNFGTLSLGNSSTTFHMTGGTWLQQGAMTVNHGGVLATIDGGGLLLALGGITVGNGGNYGGTLVVSNTSLTTYGLTIGGGGGGTVNVINASMNVIGGSSWAYSGGNAVFNMINSTVSNGALNISCAANLGNHGTVTQAGGTWTATNSVAFCNSVNDGGNTTAYSLSNGVFQETAGAFTLGDSVTTGQVYMAGTQRVFQVPSISISQLSSISNNIAKLPGGVDITTTNAGSLNIASNGVISLVFQQGPAAAGNYWGLRWLGTNHVAALNAFHTAVPPGLRWDTSAISSIYTNQVGIYTGFEGSVGYTYVGLQISHIITPNGGMTIFFR